MGSVYKAADRVLRRFVAIKLLHTSTSQNPSAVERFVREARAAASIGHPNIIDILDFGYEGKQPFLVMEYVRGRSLSETLALESSFDIERACSVATHSLAGLSAAHDRGILHRDIKPANLMLVAYLGDRNFVKICDFGFAALVTPSVRIGKKDLTPARTLVGTPAYAAPERLEGDDRRDPRLDVYSIGVVLFEMLAGRRPFDAPTFRKLAKKVRFEPPPSLRKYRSDIPPELDAIVQRALSKKREQRFANAEAFAAALVPFGGRFIPLDDCPSDSFTMDLIHLRARETQRQRAVAADAAEKLLALKRRQEEEEVGKAVGPAARPTPRPPRPRRAPPLTKIPPTKPPAPPPANEQRPSPSHAQRTGPISSHDIPRTDPGRPPRMETEIVTELYDLKKTQIHQPQATAPLSVDAPADLRPSFAPMAMPQQLNGAMVGQLVVPMLRFVSRRFGERALRDCLGQLSAPTQMVFQQGITADMWVPLDAIVEFVGKVDATLGADDLHLVVQCGRASAEGLFDMVRALDATSPEIVLSELPRLFSTVVRGVEYDTRRVGKGYGRVAFIELGPTSLVASVTSLGLIDRLLDRFGASEVEVNMITCRALEDRETVYDISWLSN